MRPRSCNLVSDTVFVPHILLKSPSRAFFSSFFFFFWWSCFGGVHAAVELHHHWIVKAGSAPFTSSRGKQQHELAPWLRTSFSYPVCQSSHETPHDLRDVFALAPAPIQAASHLLSSHQHRGDRDLTRPSEQIAVLLCDKRHVEDVAQPTQSGLSLDRIYQPKYFRPVIEPFPQDRPAPGLLLPSSRRILPTELYYYGHCLPLEITWNRLELPFDNRRSCQARTAGPSVKSLVTRQIHSSAGTRLPS